MSSFPIRLFENKVAVVKDDSMERTDGGLFLPGKAQSKPMFGRVVGVGPGIMRGDGSRVPMPVEIGDRVVFDEHRAATEYRYRGQVYHIFNSNDFLGVWIGDVSADEEDRQEVSVRDEQAANA